MSKSFMAILAGVLVGLIGLFILAGGKSENTKVAFTGDPFVAQEDDFKSGAGNKDVTLIEYGDFACPGCGALFPLLDNLKTVKGDDIEIIFRHFPLSSIHPNALAAHRAAEVAGDQGLFWEFHDQLYLNQTSWTAQSSGFTVAQAAATFRQIAEDLGMDMERYDEEVNSEAVFSRIDTDIDSGNQIDVTGTPTLILNGEIIPTPRSYDDLVALVDAEIAEFEASESGDSTESPPSTEADAEVETPESEN